MTNIPSPADPDARIRVAIADDQQLVRSGFGMLLSSQPDMAVVGEAGTGQEAIALVERVLVDVILMDVRMPGMDGLAATQAIVEQARASGCHQRPRVIILTTFALDEYVFQAIEAGASGFLLKDADPEELLQAVRTVHRGGCGHRAADDAAIAGCAHADTSGSRPGPLEPAARDAGKPDAPRTGGAGPARPGQVECGDRR